MLVSVVMPSLNSGRYIGSAIRSLLGQSGPEAELLIQDGGSSDDTLEVVAGFDDERINLVSEADAGQADALNRAIAAARGEWVLWLNADDEIAPGAFTRTAAALGGPCDVVYGDYELIDERGALVKTYHSPPSLSKRRLLTHGCYVFSGTMFIRREVFTHTGPFDTGLDCAMDYDYFLRIAPEVNAVHCGNVLARYREQPANKTSTRRWTFFRESAMLRRRHGGFTPALAVPTTLGVVKLGGYCLTRPVWRSRAWRRIRPRKRL